MVDPVEDSYTVLDDYGDDCDDYYGLSDDSDKDESVLRFVVATN